MEGKEAVSERNAKAIDTHPWVRLMLIVLEDGEVFSSRIAYAGLSPRKLRYH